jgi:hypothetical protein
LRVRAAAQFGQLLRGRRPPADASLILIAYAALSSLFLGWLLLRAMLFLVRVFTLSLPAALHGIMGFSQWSGAEWVLAILAAAWQLLLIYVASRFIATTPARLRGWWRRAAASTPT